MHRHGLLLQGEERFGIRRGGVMRCLMGVLQNGAFALGVGVSERKGDHETIQLRSGQLERANLLKRILGGDDKSYNFV